MDSSHVSLTSHALYEPCIVFNKLARTTTFVLSNGLRTRGDELKVPIVWSNKISLPIKYKFMQRLRNDNLLT